MNGTARLSEPAQNIRRIAPMPHATTTATVHRAALVRQTAEAARSGRRLTAIGLRAIGLTIAEVEAEVARLTRTAH